MFRSDNAQRNSTLDLKELAKATHKSSYLLLRRAVKVRKVPKCPTVEVEDGISRILVHHFQECLDGGSLCEISD